MPHKDKEKLKKYKQEYYIKHKEEKKEYSRQYYITHKELYDKYKKGNKKDRTEYNKLCNQKYREQNLKWLCGYLGVEKVSCERCGYNENFGSIDGHHLDPSQKKYTRDTMSQWLTKSLSLFIEKVCSHRLAYLCRNCHQSLKDGIWEIKYLK